MPAPRRILHVLNYGYPAIDGYVARSIGLLTAQRQTLGYEVSAATSPFAPLTPAADPELVTDAWGPHNQIQATRYYDGGQPHRVGRWERPQIGLARPTSAVFRSELASIARRIQPDVIHAHHPHYVAAAARAVADELDLPMVYELRCFNGDYDLDARNPYFLTRGRCQNALEHRVVRAADAVVTISDGLARRIIAGGVGAEHVHVVRNSVDTTMFTPKQSNPWSANSKALHVGYATTFEAMEGLDVLVRAAGIAHRALAERGVDLSVTIAGTGRQWAAIRALVEELGLGSVVNLPGLVPYAQMPQWYRSMDLFVIPRRRAAVAADTTPLKPLEALACGLPLLASDLPAMRELLDHRDDARFVPPDDPKALAQAIGKFAAKPWQGDGRIAQRSWANEVLRYPAIYDHAEQRASRHTSNGSGAFRQPNPLRCLGKAAMRRAVDAGLPGTHPLEKHIVVCGFPRTGSTLLQVMVERCVQNVLTFSGEVEGLWAARHANRNHRFMLTKLPADIEHIPAIRGHYTAQSAAPGQPLFVLMLRDPRAVLTSHHKAYPQSRGYYVTPQRWLAVYQQFQRFKDDKDTMTLRYEDLVSDPAASQQRLTDAIGWTVNRPFAQFDQAIGHKQAARDSMTEGALGGVRPVETRRIESWRKPEHHERLAQMLADLPGMAAALVDLGYETDETWTRPYTQAEQTP